MLSATSPVGGAAWPGRGLCRRHRPEPMHAIRGRRVLGDRLCDQAFADESRLGGGQIAVEAGGDRDGRVDIDSLEVGGLFLLACRRDLAERDRLTLGRVEIADFRGDLTCLIDTQVA